MNLPNAQDASVRAALATLHPLRGFSPTDRQQELYDALLSAPCPPDDDDSGADRINLPTGKKRAIAELVIDAAQRNKQTGSASQIARADTLSPAKRPETEHWRLNHG